MLSQVTSELKNRVEDFEKKYQDQVTESKKKIKELTGVVEDIEQSWSQSWIGFHASLYFRDFQKPPTWEYEFDSEWGSLHKIPDFWIEKSYDDIISYVEHQTSGINLNCFTAEIDNAISDIETIQDCISSDFVLIKDDLRYNEEVQLVEELTNHKWGIPASDFIKYRMPKEVHSRDTFAIQQGMKVAPHISFDAKVLSYGSKISSIEDFLKKVKRLIRQLELKVQTKMVDKDSDEVMQTILNICQRFHQIAKQLRDRYNSRATLEVEDEYDVQDLFHALLKLFFDDIRPEEWNPSYAGSSSRVDFLLKDENIIIELKKTRKNLSDKEVGEQLILDVAKYRNNPSYKTLVCFVYDPEGRIGNAVGLENDLQQLSTEDMRVIVKIEPK